MKEDLLKLIDMLLEQGAKEGETEGEPYKALVELKEAVEFNKKLGDLSHEGGCALKAIIMLINAV